MIQILFPVIISIVPGHVVLRAEARVAVHAEAPAEVVVVTRKYESIVFSNLKPHFPPSYQ